MSFEISVKKVTNLKDVNGSSVFISWRRGTKKTAGDTRRVIVQKNEAVWDERIVFESKLFMDPKSQKFDEKTLSLTLKEVCGVVWCGVVWCGVVWCGVVLYVQECVVFGRVVGMCT